MATGDRGVARRAKTGGFGGVPLDFATDAPRGSAGSFTFDERQEVLELTSPSSRIEKEIEWINKKIKGLKAHEEIRKIVGGNGKVRHSL